ncbi:spore-associated protein [Streptomonospora sp. S1-112]|uniref:Spore-associated protein n=1 Tax=Streptomonospora mangrovi TaxID=2883123 RepID=A0A9X3NNV9_9ACTN|nr:spore-associated protein [Streptomonospora mangrovi]MDA0566753.1 spore-associated protein [Streptomonospora mangrovi]
MSPRKHRTRTWITATGTVAAITASLLMTSATVAQGADPAQVCRDGRAGSTYTQPVNQAAVPGGGGTVYLYYDNNTGYNCAVTMGAVSGSTYMDVGLRRTQEGAGQWDSGTFSSYAGPVYVEAKGICVDFTGAVGDRSVTVVGENCGA